MGTLRDVQSVWEAAEPPVLRFLRRALVAAAGALAAPFLALALLFALLGKPTLWWAIPAAMGAILLVGGLVVYLVIRRRVREWRARMEEAAEWEDVLRNELR